MRTYNVLVRVYIHTSFCYRKCNFPITTHACLLVGWSVGRSVVGSVIFSKKACSYTSVLLLVHLYIEPWVSPPSNFIRNYTQMILFEFSLHILSL